MEEIQRIEEWRDCPDGLTEYEVSSCGRVRNKTTHALRTLYTNNSNGYLFIVVCSFAGVKRKNLVAHRLVAKAFHGPAPPDANEVDHINHNRTDNRVENLRWTTRRDNARNMAVTAAKWPGLSFDNNKKKWNVHINYDRHAKFQCLLDTFEEAARVRNAKVAERDGPFANLIDITKIDLAALPVSTPFARLRNPTPEEKAAKTAKHRKEWNERRVICECGADICRAVLVRHLRTKVHAARVTEKKQPNDLNTNAVSPALTDEDIEALLADVLSDL